MSASATALATGIVSGEGRILPQGEIGEIYSRLATNPDFFYHNRSEKRAEIDKDC